MHVSNRVLSFGLTHDTDSIAIIRVTGLTADEDVLAWVGEATGRFVS